MSATEKSAVFGLILIIIGGLAFVAVNYQGRLSAMSKKLADNKDEIGSLEQEKEALKERVVKVETKNSELVSQIATAKEKIGLQGEEINGLKEKNESLRQRVVGLETKNDKQDDKLGTLQDTVSSQKDEIGSLREKNASLQEKIEKLETRNAGLKSQVGSLQNKTASIIEQLDAVESRLNKLPDDLASLATIDEVRALKSSISDLEQRFQKSNIEGLRKNQSDLQNQVASLEDRFKGLEVPEGAAGAPALKVGYVNAKEAFTVFTDAVSEERESAQKKNEELLALRERAIQGAITEEEYKSESIKLQAEKLKAQLAIDLAMIEEMIDAPGFTEVSDNLKQLKNQVDPIMSKLDDVLENLEYGSAISEDEQTLSQINDQYQKLDDLLTRLIESKIFQITNVRAGEKGYDLVLRQENVVLFRNGDKIDDLTGMTKQALQSDLGV